MSDNKPEIVLDGDISPLRQKLRQAGEDLKRFGSDGESALGRMAGPLGELQKRFVAIGAVLAGGAVFKEAVAQAAAWTQESVDMGAAMGMSADAASNLKAALASEGVPLDQFNGAANKLAQTLRTNEEALTATGLATRDAAGNLRPLNELTVDAIELVGKYKAGTDRAIAAQTMFGKGFEITGDLAKLNNELIAKYTERQRELGQVLTQEGVANFEAYEESQKGVDQTFRALMNTIGNAVMPVLTDLGNWFNSIGPNAVVVVKGAIGGLVAVFFGLQNAVNMVWATIKAMVASVAVPLFSLSDAMSKAVQGDFAGAKAALVAGSETVKDAWKSAWDDIVGSSTAARDKIWNLFADGNPADRAPKPTGKGANNLLGGNKDKKDKTGKEGLMPAWEAELAQMKLAFEQENGLRQFSKQQELEFWQAKLQTADKNGKEYVALTRRVATLALDIRRAEVKEALELEKAQGEGRRARLTDQIALEEQAARFALENGEITKLELLQLEEQFLQRRYEIELQAAEERRLLLENDPSSSAVALERERMAMAEIEARYKLKKNENKQDQKKEEGGLGGFFGDAAGSFGAAVQGMLTKAQTLRQGMLNIFSAIRDAFLKNVVIQPFTEWLAMQTKKLSLFLGFSKMEQVTTQATAAQSMMSTAQQATAEVGSKGASAAAGAASSVASIPYIGPILAAAAFAGTLAMVLGARSNIKSAAGGYSIPKGLNPLVQAHEEEMILPAKYANMFRAMEEQGGVVGGGGGAVHMHVHTQSTKDFERFLKTNSHALAPGLRQMARNFTSVKKS